GGPDTRGRSDRPRRPRRPRPAPRRRPRRRPGRITRVTDIIEEDAGGSAFDSAKYRQVLGHFPTGVTVITAIDDGTPVGMAIGSFASLSLEPPSILFCAGKQSSSWPKVQAAGSFCVNILADDQEDVC